MRDEKTSVQNNHFSLSLFVSLFVPLVMKYRSIFFFLVVCLLVSSLISVSFSCLVSLTVLHSFFFPFHPRTILSILSPFYSVIPSSSPPSLSSFLPLRFSCYSFFSSLFLLSSFSCREERRERKKRERENTQNGRNCKKEKRQKEQRRRISGEGEEWSGRAFLHPLNQRISIDFFPKKVGLAFYPTKFFWFLVNNCA